MREYTWLEKTPDSLSCNGECGTGTVKAPTVYSPTIRGIVVGGPLFVIT